MMHGDNTMTKVDGSSSFGQLDPLKENGHGTEGCQNHSIIENSVVDGEMKLGDYQATLEQSTFGTILNNPASCTNDTLVGASTRRPERLKIIVKRKVVADESGKEARTKSPNKRLKVDTSGFVGGQNELLELKTNTFAGSPAQGVACMDSRLDVEVEKLGVESAHVSLPVWGQPHTSTRAKTQKVMAIERNEPFQADHAVTDNKEMSPTLLDNSSQELLNSLSPASKLCDEEHIVAAKYSSAGVGLVTSASGVLEITEVGRSAPAVQLIEDSSLPTVEEYRAPEEPDTFETGSPINRGGSSDAPEPTHTPKAKRTPLFFRPAERSVDDVSLSSPSQSSNPPAPPAKRSPLPLPGSSSSLQPQLSSDKPEAEDYSRNDEDQSLSGEATDLDAFQLQFKGNFEQVEREYVPEESGSQDDEGDGAEAEDEAEVEEEEEQEGAKDEQIEELEEGEAGEAVEVEEDEIEEGDEVREADFVAVGEEEEDEGTDGLEDGDLADDEFVAGIKFDIAELDNDTHVTTTSGVVFDEKHIFRETFTTSEKSQSSMQYEASYLSASLVKSSGLGDSRFSFQSLGNGNPYPVEKDDNDPEGVFQDRNLESDQLDDTAGLDTGGTSYSQQSEDIVDEDGVSKPNLLGRVNICNRCGVQKTGSNCDCGSWSAEAESQEEGSLSPEDFSESSQVFGNSLKVERLDGNKPVDVFHNAYYVKQVDDWEPKRSTKPLVPTHSTSQPSQSSSGVKRLKVKISSGVSVKTALPTPAKGINIKDAPTTAKALLATGLLEGYQVRYLDRSGGVMLTGRIKNSGIVCDCTKCKGQQVVNVSAFEKHAGSSARHPSDFIFLENGKNLHDVMEAGWKAGTNGRKVVEALQSAMGFAARKKESNSSCTECSGTGGTLFACSGPRCSGVYHIECAGLSQPPESDWLCALCEPAENRRRLLKANSLPSREPSTGKQDSSANMHKALFLPGALPDDVEVGYYVKGQRFLTGVKKGSGICCSCCGQVISCSQFEQHAGWGSRRNPYSSIYLADGRSLHCAALALTKKLDETPVENMDYCTECGDGGDLVLCDGCPGAFHPECAGLISIPGGHWFCPRCKNQQNSVPGSVRKVTTKMRNKGGSKAGGPAVKESLDDRCTRLLKATDTVSSGCVFCRSGEFAKSGFGPRTILLCDQCEREFHVGCLKEHGLANLTELPDGEWFCEKDCQHIHGILHLLVANGMEPLAGSIVSKVIENKKHKEGPEAPEPSRFAWQLLHGRRGDPQNGKTLTEAAAIFSESFDPIVDESSGRDLIPLMVHSRSIRDQDFGGMHCVVLKRNDEVVTAALVRIFGRQFAELPLVATRAGSHGQGYCKALILSIERLLGVLNVERLVLPAAEGAEGIWVNKFGFSQLSDEESRRFRSEVQMMIFKGSSLLKKVITPMAIQ
ncbi:hypothetical protein MPTK1_2g04330 [Marchantia polymorpha subsp. ruderalis]